MSLPMNEALCIFFILTVWLLYIRHAYLKEMNPSSSFQSSRVLLFLRFGRTIGAKREHLLKELKFSYSDHVWVFPPQLQKLIYGILLGWS